MRLLLVGKFSNEWGAEHLVLRGFEQLGHAVKPIPLDSMTLAGVTGSPGDIDLIIVMQGYGVHPLAFTRLRDRLGAPIVLWHGEVMSPEWPTTDPVVQGKAQQLARIAPAFDVVAHNCACCLSTVEKLGAKRVAWCPVNGVDPERHRRMAVPWRYDVGFYGWPSPRRAMWLGALREAGLAVAWPQPQEGIYGEALTLFINECRVILNVHFSETFNTECRLYEALGCSIPVVSEPVSMPALFPPGEGVLYCETPLEMAAALKDLLANNGAEAARLGTRGHALVHGAYTYRQRCRQLLDIVGAVA